MPLHMSPQTATILEGVISGLLGGGLSVLAVLWGVRNLEKTEIRRERVSCITNLYGLRYALSDGFSARAEDQAHFMFEMNRAGALFAHDHEILNDIRDFYEVVRTKKERPYRPADSFDQEDGPPDSSAC